MTLQRAESVASSGVASSFHEVALKSGLLNQDAEQDDLQAPSLESGVFGVLFVITDHRPVRYQWILLKYFVTAWQIFNQILTPEYGWDINPRDTLWKCISVLSFRWFKDVGYQWYVAVLYSFAVLVAANLGLCVWVAWSFKEQKLDYVWPIKVVRYFAYVFLQVFDMTSLSFLQLGISCNYVAHGKTHLRMDLFPQYGCQRPPHIVNAIVSGLLLVVFVVIALLFNMAEVEVNPASKLPQALGHSGAGMTAFGIKALMTLVGVFLGWPKVAAIAYCVLAAWLTWEYLRWVPNLVTWVNCLKGGVAVAMLSVAAIQVLVVFLPDSAGPRLTAAMAICIGPAFALGAAVTWLRIRLFSAAVTRAFRNADPEAVKPQDVYHFAHPRDVEVAARCARVWTDLYTLEKSAVHRAEEIIKAGVALFPDSAFVALVYANFMLDMLGFSQTGARQLESVRKLSPGLMCRFMLFVRHQQATQKAASSNVGKGGNMDLLGYVEYQRKQRMVLRHHKDALQAMANFWRILGGSSISFTSLSRSLENIDSSVKKAESAYRVAMELYNNSPRLVRLYARFLETIKHDPWSASQYYANADRLEESKDYSGQGPSLPDGTPMSRIDEVEKGILVVNAFGDIQVANRKLHDMFGYKKGDLDGKNVTVLMPPHEAKRHPAILRRYIDSGDTAAPYFRHPVLGIHRERVALTVKISVSRASGLGEDSVFIGILELMPTEPGLGRVWATPEGVIVCCDPGFVTCFGYHPDDVIGTHLDKLLRSSSVKSADGATAEPAASDIWATNQANHDKHELVQRMLATAADGADQDEPFGSNRGSLCRVLHKYDFAKSCSIEVQRDLTDASILEVRMKLVSDEPQLLMVVERKGAIRHMSGDLAKVLGVRAGGDSGDKFGNQMAGGDHQVMLELMVEAPPCGLDDFLPSPWKAMHYKYQKYVKGGCPMLSGAWGCRATIDDGSNFAGPTMKLVGRHGKPVYVHVAVSSHEEDGEPMHVVRMARSSVETAVEERRIRLRVSLEGVVQELERHGAPLTAYADPDGPFGFPVEELVGRSFWDFLMLGVRAGARQPPELDLLAEAEAAVTGLPGRGYEGGGGAGVSPPLSDDVVWAPLDIGTFDSMVTNAMQTPGISWRVNIVSPLVAADATALGNPARTAAVLAKRTRQAILKLEVVIPKPGARDAVPNKLQVYAELWIAEAVTGVLEVDSMGRISGVVEEEMRPPGLLFGLPKEDIVGAQLGALLRLRPGQSPVGLLTDSGVAKKSALKASSRKGKVAVKVGPVHYLDGFHRDHQPLILAVQVVGKPGVGNPVIAVIRLASPAAKRAQQAAAESRAGGGPAAAAGGGSFNHQKGGHTHVSLAVADQDRSLASRGGAAGGASLSRLRQSSMARSVDVALAASLPREPRGGAPRDAGASASQMVDLLAASGTSDSDAVAAAAVAAPAAARPPPPPVPLSLSPVTMPRVAGVSSGGGEPGASALPGTSTLAAGVAGLMRAKGLSGIGGVGGSGSGEAGAASGVADSGSSSSPEKPASPLPSGPSRLYGKRPSAAVSRKPSTKDVAAAAAVADAAASALPGVPTSSAEEEQGRPVRSSFKEGEGDDRKGGKEEGSGVSGGDGRAPTTASDLKLETLSLAAGEAGSDEGADVSGLGGVNKWVATQGKFYRNRVESVDGMSRIDGDLDEEDDDGGGSFGGFSRATSSHFASPRGSMYGGPADYDENPPHPQPFGHPPPPQQQQNRYQRLPHPQQNPYQQQYGSSHLHLHPHQQGVNPHLHPQQQGGPHPYYHQYQQYGDLHHHHQYDNQHPHHRHGMGGVGAWDGRGGVGLGLGGAAGNAGAAGGGGSAEWDASGHARHHRGRRGSFLHSGSVLTDTSRGLDAMSIDQGDDHDSDGDSDGDGDSGGGSGDSDTEDPADYKRGKRYRKLVRLMNSPQARKAIIRLKFLTILAVLAAVSIHVLSFSLIITSIKRQSAALDELAEAGGGQRYLQRALVAVRALDQMTKGKDAQGTYGTNDTQVYATDLLTHADMYRVTSKGLLQRNGGKVEQLFYSHTVEVWSGVNATTQADVYEGIALWDILTRVYVSARSVFQSHASWHQQGLDMAAVLPVEFLLRSGQALSRGMRPVLDALLDSAVTWTHTVNHLQLTFLLVEGLCVAGCCAAGLMYMLKSAFDQRYQLYETFLSIPIGLTRALAAQTTHMLDDDESDSQSEDEEDKEHYDEVPPSAVPHGGVRRRALFEERATVFDDGGGGGDGDCGDRQGEASGAEGKSQPRDRLADDDSEPPPGRRALAQSKGRSASKRFVPPDDDSFGPLGDLSLLTPTADPTNHTLRTLDHGSAKGWRAFCGCLPSFLRRGRGAAVQPLSVGAGESALQPRRSLIRNSKVAKGMLSLVVIYSILVILFYAVNYAILLNVTDQVALQAVANQNAERTYRAVFYAQELAAEQDVAAVPGRVRLLRNATTALRDAYYTMRMGAEAWTVVGPDVERFPQVVGHGLVKDSPAMFDLFYTDNTCLRLPSHWPCPRSDYRYYEVSRSGADGMMIALLDELGNLAEEAMAAVEAAASAGGGDLTAAAAVAAVQLPGLNSSRWDFIYSIGTIDLDDANLQICEQHISDVRDVLQVVIVLHVVLLLLLMGLFLSFLFLGYLPLLRRMDKEKRRIAEMMSQLPAELDVMRLFSAVLLGHVKGGSHAHGRHSQAGVGGGGSGGGAGGGGVSSNRAPSPDDGDDGDDDGSGPVRPKSPVAAAAVAAAAAAAMNGLAGGGVLSASKGDDSSAANGTADATAAGVGKGYQAWKDILARGSLSGANGTANPAVMPRAKTKSQSQL